MQVPNLDLITRYAEGHLLNLNRFTPLITIFPPRVVSRISKPDDGNQENSQHYMPYLWHSGEGKQCEAVLAVSLEKVNFNLGLLEKQFSEK